MSYRRPPVQERREAIFCRLFHPREVLAIWADLLYGFVTRTEVVYHKERIPLGLNS